MGEFVDNNFIFSIVMDCNFHGNFEDAIKSIINQSLNFEDNAQIIFINSDNASSYYEDIALKYKKTYPNNILTLFDNEKNSNAINNENYYYNLAIDNADALLINFMNEGIFSKNLLESVSDFYFDNDCEDYDFISVPIRFLESNKKHFLNYKFKKSAVVDPLKNREYIQTRINNAFIKRKAIGDLKFNQDLSDFSDSLFINELLISKSKYAIVNNCYLSLHDSIDFDEKKHLLSFMSFTEQLIDCFKDSDSIPDYMQYLFIYYLKDLIRIPVEDIFNKQELADFWNHINALFDLIDLNIILKFKSINGYVKSFLVFLKNKKEYDINVENGFPVLRSKDYVIDNLEKRKLWVDIVDIRNGILSISGSFTTSFSKDSLSITAVRKSKLGSERFEGKAVEYERDPRRKTVKYFSIPWKSIFSFDFKIPLDDTETNVYLKLHYNENGNIVHFNRDIEFPKYAELSNYSHYSIKDSKMIIFKNNRFFIKPVSYSRIIKQEALDLRKMFSDKKYSFDSILYRLLAVIAYPFSKSKKVWLFMDRQDICGDNGEHLFNYAINQKDDIKKYFVIKKDSEDYSRLKKEYGNNILAFGSYKHKYLYLISDKIMSSHPDDFILNPFPQRNRQFLSGFLTIKKYFLQHGVGKYDMSRWLRKYDKNLYLLLAVSDLDYNSFAGDNYNFDEEVVQALGFPRYDNLTNENLKKQIVIIPTWRSNLETREDLIASEYIHRWNSLLNNEKLINHAKEKGYDIVFKPHPKSLDYSDLFDTHNVKLDNVKGYHQILCDSALMVTDYSSVAFDFAYLNKPVVYYQYGDDYHFDTESAIATDEVDFGEVIKDEDALVDKIISYLDNDCKMEDEYAEKVKRFFKFTDKNNSKRVYDWIYNH